MLGHVHCYFADVVCAINEKHIQQPFESADLPTGLGKWIAVLLMRLVLGGHMYMVADIYIYEHTYIYIYIYLYMYNYIYIYYIYISIYTCMY